jgi:hypothetical protein
MQDATLHSQGYLPAAGATNVTPALDLHVDGDSFGNAWRLGVILVTVPAMPNHTDPTKTITLSMQQTPNGGALANTVPLIQVQIPGMAITGSVATTVKCPLPPLLTGPIQFSQLVPAGDGNNTGALITYDWINE